MKSYFLLSVVILILFPFTNILCQRIPDSLTDKLKVASDDSERARTLLDIGEAIEEKVPEQSLGFYKQSLELSKKIKNSHLILSSYIDIGIAYIELNKLDSAKVILQEGLLFAQRVKDTFEMAKITNNLGNIEFFLKNKSGAIENYIKSVSLWEKCSDKRKLPIVYSNINGLLNEQGEYFKAIEYGNRAINLSMKLNDSLSLVNSLVNLADTYGYLKKPDEEYQLLIKALPVAKKLGNLEQVSTIYHDIGATWFAKDNYRLSLEYFLHSLEYVKQMGNKYHQCTLDAALAQVYNKLGQHDKALKYILESEKLANEIGARADLNEIYKTRADIERKAGHYKVAGNYYLKALEISDSLFKVETSEKVAEAEAKYQNAKKEQQIIQLQKDKEIQALSIKQKSTLNYIFIGSLAALIIIGFLWYRNLSHRQKLTKQQEELHRQRIIELEKDKQLIAVDSILKGQEEERSRLARDLHDGLGGLLSGVKFSLSNMKDNLIITPDNMTVFARSLDMLDTSILELRRVAHNMMPEMLTKFGLDEALKEYCNTINTTKLLEVKYQSIGMERKIGKSEEIIVYRIVQELMNNVMKHSGATEAMVQLVKEEGRFNIIVEDNGKGFDTSKLKSNTGIGIANIQSRVDYLRGRLDIHSDEGKGTLVNIEFNI